MQVPLNCVVWAEKIIGIYDYCFFNNPDEVFCLHKMKGITTTFSLTELKIGKNVEAFRVKNNMILVKPLQIYIMVLQENFKITLFKKDSMKPFKEYDLMEHFEESAMRNKTIGSSF